MKRSPRRGNKAVAEVGLHVPALVGASLKSMGKRGTQQFVLRNDTHVPTSRAERNPIHRDWCATMVGDLYSDDLRTIESLFSEALKIARFSGFLNWTGSEATTPLYSVKQFSFRPSSGQQPLRNLPTKREPCDEKRDARDDERNEIRVHASSVRTGTDILAGRPAHLSPTRP